MNALLHEANIGTRRNVGAQAHVHTQTQDASRGKYSICKIRIRHWAMRNACVYFFDDVVIAIANMHTVSKNGSLF